MILFLSSCGGGGGSGTTQSQDDTTDTNNQTNPDSSSNFAKLCSSNGVLFCDNFEEGISDGWTRDGGDVQLVSDQVKSSEGSSVLELRTYDSIQSSKLLYTFTGQNEVYVRYDVKYALDYDNSGGSHGPVLGGSQSPPWGMMGTAGKPPTGEDYFVLNHEPHKIVGTGGEFGFYAYFVNMSGIWGNLRLSSLDPKPVIKPGEWHCVEFGLRLNTANVTSTNGKAYFWIDGVQHGDFDGFQWRTSIKLMINTFMLDSYNHFNKGTLPASSPNRVRYDNVIISTQPVGCLS